MAQETIEQATLRIKTAAFRLAKLPEVQAAVKSIEDSVPATLNHYDEYMVLLAKVSEHEPIGKVTDARSNLTNIRFWGIVLTLAGANPEGIKAAMSAGWDWSPEEII